MRDTQIQARCTHAEREAIKARAERAGVSLSRYVVLCALGAPPPPLPGAAQRDERDERD